MSHTIALSVLFKLESIMSIPFEMIQICISPDLALLANEWVVPD